MRSYETRSARLVSIEEHKEMSHAHIYVFSVKGSTFDGGIEQTAIALRDAPGTYEFGVEYFIEVSVRAKPSARQRPYSGVQIGNGNVQTNTFS